MEIPVTKVCKKYGINIEYIDNPYDFFQQYTCADLTETKKYKMTLWIYATQS